MNPSPKHKQVVRQVERLVKLWRPRFAWLLEWELSVRPAELAEDRSEVAMSVQYFEYTQEAIIHVRPPALDLDLPTLERTLLHEMGHIFLADLHLAYLNALGPDDELDHRFTAWSDTEERLCWRFARMLQALDARER